MTMGIGAVEINAAQFGATARARNFSTNFPLRDEINEDDIGPLTLDACVCKADPAFKANVRGRTDGKIGTLKKTGVFRGTKVRVDDMSAKPDAFPVDINDLELWNGLFVTKGTPQDVIDKLAEIGEATMASDEAQQLMKETGARVYWQGMAESMARIDEDRRKAAEIAAMIN